MTQSHNPFRVDGTDMPPNLLLMAKLLVVCFMLTEQWGLLPDHFLPFVPFFDRLLEPRTFELIVKAVFLIAAAALLFNYRVRMASLTLGSLVLISILSSRPYFQNNRTFTGCLWFVAGLHVPGQKPWTVRYQVVLLYAGATLNKLLDADWRTGQFFENMEANLGRHRMFYVWISSFLPPMWLSIIMSWTTILTEGVLATGFILLSAIGPVIWLGIAYHTTLLVLTGYSFGMFYYATLSSFLAFVEPQRPAVSRVNSPAWLRTYVGLLYNPITWFIFAFLMAAPVPGTLLKRVTAILLLAFVSPVCFSHYARRFSGSLGALAVAA